LKYRSKNDAQKDHIDNYRSDGISNAKGTPQSRDFYRYMWVLDQTPENSIVLDIGCNTGLFAIPLQEKKNCYVRGIDIVPELVEKAKKRGVRAEIGEAENLSQFENNKFDVVLCCEVLEHLFNPMHAISEIHRVLKVGGKLIVTVPHPASKICESLGDFHHQNFTGESIFKLMFSKFKNGDVMYNEMAFTENYCNEMCIPIADPQYLGLEAYKK
tara:strand:+ start:4534 stop:5175 length:642 start_codon:yes stop_codon:yes gene_type:complete